MASLRALNQRLARADTHGAVLDVLQQETRLAQYAAGLSLNSVNFSTALHRLARHAAQPSSGQFTQVRAEILGDPRTALLLASAVEGLISQDVPFRCRELSNMGWALAKLKLAPPATVMPLNEDMDSAAQNLQDAATAVRRAVLQVATQRRQQQPQQGVQQAPTWIPALSQLAGHLLDYIGWWTVANDTTRSCQLQECSNLLWAWATAGRNSDAVFGTVALRMIEQQRAQLLQQQQTRQPQPPTPLRPQEWSNTIWSFATVQCYQHHDALLEFVAFELLDQPDSSEFLDAFKSQELANTVWGVATLLSNKKQAVGSLTDQEQAAALTILRHASGSVVRRLQQRQPFRTQELANTMWALATLGFGISSLSSNGSSPQPLLNNYVVLPSDQAASDAALVQSVIEAVIPAARQLLPRFVSQELNNLTWALARLLSNSNINSSSSSDQTSNDNNTLSPGLVALLQGIGAELSDIRRSVSPQDIGTTLWGMATLGFSDMKVYRGLVSRLLFIPDEFLSRCKPQEISNVLWAFATVDAEIGDRDCFDTSLVPAALRTEPSDPVTRCFALAARELMRRPHQFKVQEIKDVLWSFSKVGLRHPALFRAVAEHLVGREEEEQQQYDDGGAGGDNGNILQKKQPRSDELPRGMEEFSSQGLGNLAWAYARQAQLSQESRARIDFGGRNGRLMVYRTSYFDTGEALLHKLFGALGDASVLVHEEMRMGKPQDIANTAWAFAVLGLKDVDFMETAVAQLDDRLGRFVRGERNALTIFKGQELANLLWSLATLNLSCSAFLESLVAYLRVSCQDSKGKITAASIARVFNRQELANMAWSCAVFGNYPEPLMNILYTGLVGWGEGHDPNHLSQVHRDSGLQQQAIMTLIYVQAALDLKRCCSHLTLPPDFPDGWAQSSTSSSQSKHNDDHMTELDFELNLNTSKIQRQVAAAFARINFDIIEEHTITMEEMALESGVRLPPKKMEILSIDIANVEEKIAIEVDGPAHFISRIEDVADHGNRQMGYSKIVNGKREYQFAWTGAQQEMNGPTALKHRLLVDFGWKVIHVPFWDWYALNGDPDREDEYCRQLLEKP